ncbi:helix-turn-helix transcriptional regulator [Paractinoplanes lichenicola]|uniref:AAA family ATPase n=1 Tax=Paractinoplanes lichenicola TaxID=2802976 RepID=A0ABS1VQ43_9ACTN|nr:LuxR family transcriptional regulator [Actinoplanes lichenicola]MBL7256839.1 AAA family ATPase [Actinoplanes lichenicola]
MALLERDQALTALTAYADEARHGDGRLVLISGEAGIGKSALVEALPTEGRRATGFCDGLFTPRPLGPLFDLAAELGGELQELCRRRAPREELFDALLRELDRAFTVIVIEDLHWADEATVDLVRFLARRLRRTLLIVTYRDVESTPLRLALGHLGSLRATRRITIEPLSPAAVAQLTTGTGLPADELHKLTGGNPFYVTEIVRSGITSVPASVRDAVLARTVGLSPEARHSLDLAALTGGRFDVGDELLRTGLFTTDGFRHELARRAVEQAIPPRRRAQLHATILACLRDHGDDARLAFHAEQAGDGAAAHHFAVRAAAAAAELGAHREAAAQFERALRFAGDLPDPVRGKLLDRLCDELSLVDRGADLADAAEQARQLWHRIGDRRREGNANRRLSEALVTLCRHDEAIAVAERALKILDPLDGPDRSRAYAHLARKKMLTDHHAEAIELATRAQHLAGPLHDVLSDALNTHAGALAMSGEPWLGKMREALDVALEHGLAEQVGRAYNNFYGLLTCERRYAEAEQYFVDGVAFCDEHDVASFGTCIRGERSISLARTDRWDEAARLARRLITEVEATPINRISAQIALATVLVRRGDDEIAPLLDEAVAAADGSAEPQWIVCARLCRAEWRWLAGDLAGARREAERAFRVAGRGNGWLRGSVAVWLRRSGSKHAMSDVAEPYQLELDGDFAGSAAAWRKVESRYEAALALLGSDDTGLLREALAVFDELGALPAARLTRRRLRVHGVRSVPVGPRSATRAHPAGLTRREDEVLGLIVAGRTNAEIAARLVLSVKTVDHHVSAVLGKLGASSRSMAAAEAERRGLVSR